MVIELAINSQADNDTGLTYGQIIESDGINAGNTIWTGYVQAGAAYNIKAWVCSGI